MAKKNRGINIFRNVPKANLPRTSFNMSHQVKFSGEFGVAYPIFCQEVIAGDTWDIAVDHFARLSPMVAPVMHDLDVRFHWFFVPMRLLWDDFEEWITGGRTGTWREDNPDAFPTFNLSYAGQVVTGYSGRPDARLFNGSIFDFLGLNFGDLGLTWDDITEANQQYWRFNVMPFRGYWLIRDYFFRDQNVEEELEIPLTSGNDDLEWLLEGQSRFGATDGLFRVAWDKDYFTSATLTPQRGPQVYVPIGAQAPLVNVDPAFVDGLVRAEGTRVNVSNGTSSVTGSIDTRVVQGGQVLGTGSAGLVDLSKGMVADLSSSQGAAVDDVREAFALQRFFERMQIVGSRFSEFLRGIFGTNAGDARLQMPEYLGSWQNPFMINNVSQTSATTGTSPQGGYSGNGMASQRNSPIRKYFSEPGYLYGIYVAMPRNGYFQGVDKKLLRIDWLDFFNPYFEHIGEQPIMSSELYFNPIDSPQQEKVFGYQSQYASYKFINSHVHGQFKDSLDFWTAARKFSEEPTLSNEFIYYDKEESTDRLFTLTDEPKFYVQLDVKAFAERPMTPYSTPKLI